MNNVNQIFEEVIQFWFLNEDLWFNASYEDDLMITNKYEALLDNVDKDFDEIVLLNENNNIKLGLILLYDQIGRHICRVHKKSHTSYFNKIYGIAKSIIENRAFLELYKPEERVFILLVYRHTFDKAHIELVIDIIQQWRHINNLSLYKRFYQASLNSLAKINNNQDLVYNNTADYMDDEINSILDIDLSPKMDEVLSFKVNKDVIYETEIYKVFEASMIEILRLKSNTTCSASPRESASSMESLSRNIGISVSGGVDSMVCTLLTYAFSYKHKYNPIVFSVNYGNRIEQNIEIYMINKYIKYLNKHLVYQKSIFYYPNTNKNHYVRVINEIKRIHGTSDLNDRDLYEDFTRNIRFNCYKNVSTTTCGNQIDLPFILGHNRDDSLENVISNIKKERSYQNLFGMNVIGYEKDVTLFRPLLSVWKRDIIEFARKFKIPFIYDSTPSWCERGKMRDVLFPFLNQFDTRILDGLFSLSTNFKEIYKVYENSIPNIIYNNDYAIVEDKQIYFEDYFKKILQCIVSHYGIYPIRNKSIAHLVNTLKNNKHILKFNKNIHKITLSKQLYCVKNIIEYEDSNENETIYQFTFFIVK